MPRRRPRPLPKLAGLAAALLSVLSVLAEPTALKLAQQLLDLVHRTDLAPLALKLFGIVTTAVALLSHSLTGTGGRPHPTTTTDANRAEPAP